MCAGLLDAGCDPRRVAEMLSPLGSRELAADDTLAARLVGACDARGELALLRPWLEAREAEAGSEGLEEGGAGLAAVRGALKKLRPKGLFGFGGG